MYVNRRVWIAPPFESEKVFELCKRMMHHGSWPHKARVYHSEFGEFNHVVLEVECESLAEYEKLLPEFWGGLSEDLLAEAHSFPMHGRNEFWKVAEK